jgi:PAS domain S-box-containing protein
MDEPPEIIKILRAEEQQGILLYCTCNQIEQIYKDDQNNDPVVTSTMLPSHQEGKVCVGVEQVRWDDTAGTLLDTVINGLSDVFYVFDEHRRFLKWNTSLEKITGYTHKEIQSMKPTDFFTKKDVNKVRQAINILFKEKSVNFEAEFKTKDGKSIPMFFSGKLMIDECNNPFIFGIGKDITDLKKLQETIKQSTKALEDSEEQLDDLIENANDLIQSINASGKFVYVNKTWRKKLGYTENEIKKLTFTNIIRKDHIPHCQKIFTEVSKGKRKENIETVFITKNGQEIAVEGNVNGLFKNGKFVSTRAIFRDITERKKAENELNTAHALLKNANQQLENMVKERTAQIQNLLIQKDRFIGQLGHDLKTPLSILINILPMIYEAIDNQEAKEDCEIALRNVNYIKHLVVETLQIAELSSPNIVLDRKPVNLKTLISDVIKDNEPISKEKNIRVINLIFDDILLSLDELKIKEVLYNLLNNALNFTSDGGTITFDTRDSGDNTITVEVRDDGIGMTPEQINKVFTDFYKADISRHNLGGSGLGLGICKRIIEKHSGRMWAESEGKGKGSKFYFKLLK